MIDDLVSIVIPVYNAEKYLVDTIESIERQTYQNYEAIFIDDCSTDNSVAIIERYKVNNFRFSIIKLNSHQGVSKARNIGISKAKGRYLTFLDADDIWLEYKLEHQLEFIQKHHYSFVYCNFRYMSYDGIWLSKVIRALYKTDYHTALLDTRILTITAMIDLTLVPKKYCYMPDIMNEDVVTWWNILKNGHIAYCQAEVLAYYRRTKNSRSSKKWLTAFYRWKLYREFENLNLFRSMWCFTNYVINAIKKRLCNLKKIKRQSFSKEKVERLQVAVSTQNLLSDNEVKKLLTRMQVCSDYLIVNQIHRKKVCITNPNVITKRERGLSKSRNIAIFEARGDIVLLADDDVVYDSSYEEIILDAYQRYMDADIICFYVESKNSRRRTKRVFTRKIGYLSAMRIVSSEISFRKSSIINSGLTFHEKFGAGAELNRGEEQIFLYEALRAGLKVIFVNKTIASMEQSESTWFLKYDESFFRIQGEVFRQLTRKFYVLLILQYAVRKYFLYFRDVSFIKAVSYMLAGKK